MNDMTPAVPGIGHNSEEEEASELVKKLRASYAELFAKVQEYIDRAATVPSKIEDDPTQEKVLDLLKMASATAKTLDFARKEEIKPHKKMVDETNGVFTKRKEALEKAMERVIAANEDYVKAKAAAEKRRLEEEAEKRRLEAERLQREAAEAEAAATAARAKAKAIRETALFYTRQRTTDLLTQTAVTVQGYLALDLVRGAWRSRETWGRWAAAAMAISATPLVIAQLGQ